MAASSEEDQGAPSRSPAATTLPRKSAWSTATWPSTTWQSNRPHCSLQQRGAGAPRSVRGVREVVRCASGERRAQGRPVGGVRQDVDREGPSLLDRVPSPRRLPQRHQHERRLEAHADHGVGRAAMRSGRAGTGDGDPGGEGARDSAHRGGIDDSFSEAGDASSVSGGDACVFGDMPGERPPVCDRVTDRHSGSSRTASCKRNANLVEVRSAP